jgi:hypothetical protein
MSGPSGEGGKVDALVRDHLFVSYAWEDGALAEWLTLRLTALGYSVWCDRFKLLGGESWPKDIDEAIKDRTFRMLHLVSAYSLRKENPTKERQLALALQRERNTELFIPLNVDGTKPSELNWQISDINYIPFVDWGAGLKQLLQKLDRVNAPKPLAAAGQQAARDALLPPDVLLEEPEPLYSNWFPFVAIPAAILRFTAKPKDSDSVWLAMKSAWAFRRVEDTFYSLVKPPAGVPESSQLKAAGGASWKDADEIDELRTSDLLFELLNKSLYVRCLARGLQELGDGQTVYFPTGLVLGDRLRFATAEGKKTHVRLFGRRKSGTSRFHYHLGFILRARQGVGTEPVAQLKLRLHVTGSTGQSVTPAMAFRRGLSVRRGWWNRQQLLRQTGVMEFLSAGSDSVALAPDSGSTFALARLPLSYTIRVRINEGVLALAGDEELLLEGGPDGLALDASPETLGDR